MRLVKRDSRLDTNRFPSPKILAHVEAIKACPHVRINEIENVRQGQVECKLIALVTVEVPDVLRAGIALTAIHSLLERSGIRQFPFLVPVIKSDAFAGKPISKSPDERDRPVSLSIDLTDAGSNSRKDDRKRRRFPVVRNNPDSTSCCICDGGQQFRMLRQTAVEKLRPESNNVFVLTEGWREETVAENCEDEGMESKSGHRETVLLADQRNGFDLDLDILR